MTSDYIKLLAVRNPVYLWKGAMAIALLLFAKEAVSLLQQPALVPILVVTSYVLVLPLFAVGDSAVISTTMDIYKSDDAGKTIIQKHLPAEAFLMVLHAAVIIALALVCFRDPLAYMGLYAVLAGANIIWIALKLMQFMRAIRTGSLTRPLADNTWHCITAMVTWMAINGLFLVINGLLLSIRANVPDWSRVIEITLVAAAIARSIVDVACCYGFYAKALAGGFCLTGRSDWKSDAGTLE